MTSITLPSEEICDRARAAKDARFDGLFFTAVRSTRIYCRPVCPAPTPKRSNIVYYATAAAAAAAGFRPCLRCRPELSPGAAVRGGEDLLQRALGLIADDALREGSVEALARRLGVSARHLRRVFIEQTGVTPLALHATQRLLLAKQLLTETGMPVTQIALAAGYRSLRRFNAAFADGCGMPPTAIRRQRAPAPQDGLSLRLAYRPPFDFASMLGFLAKRAIPGIERVGPDSYERVLGPADASTFVRVTEVANQPELRLQVSGADARAIPAIVRGVRRLFDLDADPGAVHAILRKDPLLVKAIRRRPGLRVPGAWDGFELALRAVLGQQVSVAGATTLARRLVDGYGTQRSDGRDGLDRVFPSPADLIGAPLETLGLPKTRAACLRSLAAAVLDHRLDFQPGQSLPTFVARCIALPGIGPWTAHYIAMRALRHPDAFPAGDLILQQVLGGVQRLSERATEARSQAWRPWRAYAVLHLWYLSNDSAVEKA